jgi:hypothetical protein
MSLDLPSNVDAIQRLPQGLRGDNTVAWLTIYLARLDAMQSVIDDFLSGLLSWDVIGFATPALALAAVGRLLGQPRPTGATDDEYKRVLRVRRIVRRSTGTAPNIREVVRLLGDYGGGASVVMLPPNTVIVTFANFAAVAAQGLTLDVVTSLLIDTIGDVDRLQIFDAVGNVFTWDVEGKGWDQAVWAAILYDSGT